MDAIRGLCMEGLVHQNFHYFNESLCLDNPNVFVNKLSSYIQLLKNK